MVLQNWVTVRCVSRPSVLNQMQNCLPKGQIPFFYFLFLDMDRTESILVHGQTVKVYMLQLLFVFNA